MTRPYALTAAALASTLMLAGCGSPGGGGEDIARTSVCAVSAPAGFDDYGLGRAVFDQVRFAVKEGVVDSTSSQRVSTASQTRAALERNAAESCTLTVLVGPGGGQVLAEVAESAPHQAFLAVGAADEAGMPDNVLTIDFDLMEPAYLAGYAAASATETGTVAAAVSQGFPAGAEVLEAFDAGARERAAQSGEDVTVLGAGATAERTLSDTTDAGAAWARGAAGSGADVLAPFGSAAPQGAAEHLAQEVERAEAVEDEGLGGDEAGEDGAGAGEDSAGEGGAEDAAGTNEDSAAGGGAESREDALPRLIWYGADGSKVLPRSVRELVVASVVPDPGLGLRALLAGWPGEGGEPEALLAGAEHEAGEQAVEAQLVAGLEVRSRHATGDLDNEGVTVVASDGVLSSVTGLGRKLGDERKRMEDG